MSDLNPKITVELVDKVTAPLKYIQNSFKELIGIQKEILESTKAITSATKANTAAAETNAGAIKKLAGSLLELGAGLGIKSKLSEILEVGKEFQNSKFKLSAVLGLDMANKDLAKYIDNFKSLASQGLGSYDEVSNTGYALFSAGLSKEEAMEGTKVALEVARITGGNAEEVGNIMATASKDFKVSMNRVGDIFTYAQSKFQIKDFLQLEEGLKYVAATASSVKMPIEQATTVLGALNNAGKNGSLAGTGLNQIINQMSKVDKALGITVPRLKDGSIDFIKWSKVVADKLKAQTGGDLNKEHALENKLFGTEGGSAFAVLMNYMKELPGYLDEVKNSSSGIVKTNTAKYLEAFSAKTLALNNSLLILYASITESVIPILTKVLDAINPLIKGLASLINKHQWLGKAMFFTGGALAVLLKLTAVYNLIVKPLITTLIALNVVVKALRLTTLLFNTALWSNPLVLIIAGIVAAVGMLGFAVYEVIKHWKIIKKFFSSLWSFMKTGFQTAVDFITNLWQSIVGVVEKVASWFGLNGKTLEITATKDLNNTVTLTTKDNSGGNNGTTTNPSAPKNPPPKPTQHVTYNNTFHINGNNLNHDEIATHVAKKLKNQHQTSMAY